MRTGFPAKKHVDSARKRAYRQRRRWFSMRSLQPDFQQFETVSDSQKVGFQWKYWQLLNKPFIRIHLPQAKAWECNNCNKRYSSKNLLEEHMNTHLGVRPYVCNTCGKDFANKYSFRAHEKTHSSRPRPFEYVLAVVFCGSSWFFFLVHNAGAKNAESPFWLNRTWRSTTRRTYRTKSTCVWLAINDLDLLITLT